MQMLKAFVHESILMSLRYREFLIVKGMISNALSLIPSLPPMIILWSWTKMGSSS